MNTIDAVKNLSGVPVSLSRMIGASAICLINAGILANDRAEAVAMARKIWGQGKRPCDLRGMWKKVQAESRKVLKVAAENGMTVAKPYVIKAHPRGGEASLWTIDFSGHLAPAKIFKGKK
jgi:hypothetical protein